MTPQKWTLSDIPDQDGRCAVVTGANSGIGAIAARELARAGAHVILACRDTSKGDRVAEEIRGALAGARVEVAALDLADLESVRAFVNDLAADTTGIDLLVNNAGLMAPPHRTTAQGFELQLGTNYLGHFALTGLLLDRLLSRPQPRVVTLSSNAHKLGKIDFDDLQSERGYNRWSAYNQSKLACLVFALELDRRARAAGAALRSLAAHPGYSATNLQSAAAPLTDRLIMGVANRVVAQSAEHGALPTLRAATDPELEGGTYVGPDGWHEFRGSPVVVRPLDRALDLETAERLWEVSEELTGVRFAFRETAVP